MHQCIINIHHVAEYVYQQIDKQNKGMRKILFFVRLLLFGQNCEKHFRIRLWPSQTINKNDNNNKIIMGAWGDTYFGIRSGGLPMKREKRNELQ